MSGVIRFYAAILITSPPQGAHHPHPHGLEHAWIWLSRSLNLQPNPDITATAIYDMLQVRGVDVHSCQPLHFGHSLLRPRALHYAHDRNTMLFPQKTKCFYFQSCACVCASNVPATSCACAFFVSVVLVVPQPTGVCILNQLPGETTSIFSHLKLPC